MQATTLRQRKEVTSSSSGAEEYQQQIARIIKANQQKQSRQFNLEELKVISDALHFLQACLDRESVSLFKDIAVLLVKVDKMVKECSQQ